MEFEIHDQTPTFIRKFYSHYFNMMAAFKTCNSLTRRRRRIKITLVTMLSKRKWPVNLLQRLPPKLVHLS
jgi:hypothetical protein